MTIRHVIGQGLHYARTCRSLWLFGFFVGIASGGSSGGGAGGGGGEGGFSVGIGGLAFTGLAFDRLERLEIARIALVILLAFAVLIVMRAVGEGALIEGVARARQGGTLTTREGFRAGWAHGGVLARIALLYLATTIGSVALLAAPAVLAVQAFGPRGGVLLGIPAVLVAIPWLITLYLVQAFASRIAVLENRHAFDAIGKARLFMHGRLMHGLELAMASFVGTLGIVVVALAAMAPVALLLVALLPALRVVPVMALGGLVLLPAIYVFAAVVGTFRSSVWTIGYLTQVES